MQNPLLRLSNCIFNGSSGVCVHTGGETIVLPLPGPDCEDGSAALKRQKNGNEPKAVLQSSAGLLLGLGGRLPGRGS